MDIKWGTLWTYIWTYIFCMIAISSHRYNIKHCIKLPASDKGSVQIFHRYLGNWESWLFSTTVEIWIVLMGKLYSSYFYSFLSRLLLNTWIKRLYFRKKQEYCYLSIYILSCIGSSESSHLALEDSSHLLSLNSFWAWVPVIPPLVHRPHKVPSKTWLAVHRFWSSKFLKFSFKFLVL